MSDAGYLLAGQAGEIARLRLQSEVWEPDGRALLARLGDGSGARVVDVGCGAMGWLRLLSEWVGPTGEVVGTDYDRRMLEAARALAASEGLANVRLVEDDLFDSRLPAASFDLVHARYEVTPLGRGAEQLSAHRRLARPGAWIALEECDCASWRFHPSAPAAQRLVDLVVQAFSLNGGDFTAGRGLRALMVEAGIDPELDVAVHALPPGHPYARVVLQFAKSLEPRLLDLLPADRLARLCDAAEAELADPGRWSTTWLLVQAWGRSPG